MPKRILTGAQAIREAINQSMEQDPSVFIIGEGVPDPKGIFGTTLNLKERYGGRRVWDMPVSENGVTGMCIGAALHGFRPILTHQRLDFALLSLDQIINNAAKWFYMFGGQKSVPLVIRLIIGHGWGQGAQHSQNLQAIFAHVPGLKVVAPSTPYEAKGLLAASIQDNNPVIFIEDRWIHGLKGEVPEKLYTSPLGKAHVLQRGKDITLVAASYMAVETLRAARLLQEAGIRAEVIDLRTIAPLDEATIISSVKKTHHLLVIDNASPHMGLSADVIARVTEQAFTSLHKAPGRITPPPLPSPSAPALTKHYYPTYQTIVLRVLQMLGKNKSEFIKRWQAEDAKTKVLYDVPDTSFTGPF